ncbi:phospholipid carrier-dependent glycosyltransferase [Novosphingobium sp. KCTC 2891]|uniref:phospholipid carrier-dependent glycosyltransferase n=1 Tax=Novosphingobium sp. KCTC 2891 TaxID=2989730 RepID=UPI00222301BA|nr:phospholipid carrier-dependent glycosyltransferase [Novosphingobium sp. KCTC 2891]MCW1384016.1 phospholipid carrier-dependent glycosyltransferase [Novosphingobium sp. KCTC 2891]
MKILPQNSPAQAVRHPANDPLLWVLAITAAFLALALYRIGIPSKPMFDEIHYLPAARRLIDLTHRLNPEHPLLGKEMIALGMRLFGDVPFGWRAPNAVLGAIGLFAATRAVWWASLSRSTTLLFGVLMASNFIWFILSRIAMLDMAMAAMLALAFWQWAQAWRKGGRRHLVLCGAFLGLSLGAKWNGAPLLVMPGLLFAWDRWQALRGRRGQFLTARDAGPVPGVSLIEAGVWLGLWPLVAYFATFAPAFFYHVQPMTLGGLIPWQKYMLQLQDSVVKPHTYMSRWWQWVFNIRPIWFLYQNVDGAQRGVLMLGNPFTMLAGLPALVFCAWDGVKGDKLRRGVALLYVAALIFWALNGKPVQFYYHYTLASLFLIAALALVLGEWWDNGTRWPARVAAGLSLVLFAGFYPILAAGPLPRANSYVDYTWIKSWR